MEIHRKLTCENTGAKFDVDLDFEITSEMKLNVNDKIKPVSGYVVNGRLVTPEDIKIEQKDVYLWFSGNTPINHSKNKIKLKARYFSISKRFIYILT